MNINQKQLKNYVHKPPEYLIENIENGQWNLHLVVESDMKEEFRKDRLSHYLDDIMYLNIGTYSSEEEAEFIVYATWEEYEKFYDGKIY